MARGRGLLALKYAFTVLLALLFLLPFAWMLALSVKSLGSFYDYPPSLFTADPQWSNFAEVLTQFSLFRYFFNSFIVTTAITVLQLVTASTAGFAFATLAFRGKNALFLSFLASMMVPGTVILIPLFILIQQLKLVDTYWGLILPFVFTGYGTFLIRQFFLSLPRDLFYAARVDGCSYFGVYWRMYLPLAQPALATLGALAFMYFWNSLVWPLVAVNSDDLKTIPVGIAGLAGQNARFPHLILAGTTLSVLPGLAVFLVLQRYFIRGFVLSGVKG